MAKASDNQFPKVLLVPTTTGAVTAPAGTQALLLDSGDSNKLKRKDSSGTVTTIEGGGTGGGSTGFTQLRKSADQSIPNNAWTAISWDVEDYDTLGGHDNVTNNSRFTAPTTGIYSVQIHVAFATNSANAKYLSIYRNGTQLSGWCERSTETTPTVLGLVREIALTAGDYVQAFIYQNSGGSVALQHDLATQPNGAIMTCRLVGTL